MSRVLYDTGSALLDFDRKEVMERLSSYKERLGAEIGVELMDLLSWPAKEPLVIPAEITNVLALALDLLARGIGRVTCKSCDRTYQARELKRIKVGHGESPFSVTLERRGWIKRVFKRKEKLPGMLGGKGFACPQNHELISMITWRT